MAASVAAAAAPSASVHGTSSSSSALPSAAASVAAERKNSSSSSGSCLDASALRKDAQGILARIGGTGPGSVAGGRGDRGAGRLLSSAAAAQEAADAAAAAATPDPRLRAPERERVAAPAFKLGAAIWATDGDLSQLSFQARKEAERKRKKLEEEEEKAREEEERQRRKKEKKGGGEGASKSPPRPYGDEPFKRLAAASRPVAFTSSVTPLSPSSSTANSHLSSLLLLLQSSGSLRPPRAMHECRLLSET